MTTSTFPNLSSRPVQAIVIVVALLVPAIGFGLWHWWPAPDFPRRVALAYEDGLEAMLNDSTLQFTAGEVWVLQQLRQARPDPKLSEFTDAWTRVAKSRPFGQLVDSTQAPIPLPPDPGAGWQKFAVYLMAPFGAPSTTAIQFISDFLAMDGAGYVLTHQLTVVEWAKERKLELPPAILERGKDLFKKLAVEHVADPNFSDLYAERAALLLRYTEVPAAEARQWIEIILDHQEADGLWVEKGPAFIEFEGKTDAIQAGPNSQAHITSLALWAIALYRP